MGRMVKMSAQEARSLGLLDPLVKDMMGKTNRSPAAAAPSGSAKKTAKRSLQSKPAMHPKTSLGPAGTGDLSLDDKGRVERVDFVFDVVPVPKERAKVVKDASGQKTFGFTPARTQHFHRSIKQVVRQVFGSQSPIAGPVGLDMVFFMQIPSSWPKWKQHEAREGLIVPTGRPDMDNLEKALLDAFNGIVMVDDAYVVQRKAAKIYADMPGIHASAFRLPLADIHASRDDVAKLRLARD